MASLHGELPPTSTQGEPHDRRPSSRVAQQQRRESRLHLVEEATARVAVVEDGVLLLGASGLDPGVSGGGSAQEGTASHNCWADVQSAGGSDFWPNRGAQASDLDDASSSSAANFPEIRPTPVDIGKYWPGIGRNWSDFDRTRPKFRRCQASNSPKSG